MRDDFSEKTKQAVAKRVAWKCSFPRCGRVTIGPGANSDDAVVNLGEAAHIWAASVQGPMYNPKMRAEERTSINNAIWMCRAHARLIDTDCTNYPASTLLQWKETAEKEAYQNLKELSKRHYLNSQHHGITSTRFNIRGNLEKSNRL